MTKKKLTLDDVLSKLQNEHSMTLVTETSKITGGGGETLDECHMIVTAT